MHLLGVHSFNNNLGGEGAFQGGRAQAKTLTNQLRGTLNPEPRRFPNHRHETVQQLSTLEPQLQHPSRGFRDFPDAARYAFESLLRT